MNIILIKTSSVFASLALLFTSCAEMANNPGLSALGGALAGGGVGNLIGQRTHSNNGRWVTTGVGALTGALVAYSISKSYQASQYQEELARERYENARRTQEVQQAKRKGFKYVAVPVPAKKSSGGRPGLMKVNTESGVPVSKVYEAPERADSLDSGSVVDLGGDKSYYYNTWGV